MREPYGEGLTTHTGPQLCGVAREGGKVRPCADEPTGMRSKPNSATQDLGFVTCWKRFSGAGQEDAPRARAEEQRACQHGGWTKEV